MKLVDANLLLYAYDPRADLHRASRAWLEDALSGTDLVRFAWPNLRAFLRISTNPRVYEHPLSMAERHVSSWLAQPAAGILEPGGRGPAASESTGHPRHERRQRHGLPILEDLEIVGGEVEGGLPVPIQGHDIDLDEIDGRPEDLARLGRAGARLRYHRYSVARVDIPPPRPPAELLRRVSETSHPRPANPRMANITHSVSLTPTIWANHSDAATSPTNTAPPSQ